MVPWNSLTDFSIMLLFLLVLLLMTKVIDSSINTAISTTILPIFPAICGVINQPFFGFDDESKKPDQWGRSIWGVVGLGSFGPFEQKKLAADQKIICTTRSHSSKAVNACIEAMQPDNVLRQGGAGNKVLRVIEGDAHAYVFASPGTKKWDTCAPEAILVAMGGRLTGKS